MRSKSLRYLASAACFCFSACKDVVVQEETTGQTLCFDYYQACINPVLSSMRLLSNGIEATCSAEGCHNVDVGAGGAFKLHRRARLNSSEMMGNFISAKSFTNLTDPASSKLLLEPLAGTFSIVGSHAGGDIFADPSDPGYQEIYYWISNPIDASALSCPALDQFHTDPARRCLDGS